MQTVTTYKQWVAYLLLIIGFSMASMASANTNNPETIIAEESTKLMGMVTGAKASFSSNPQPFYAQVTNQLRGIADIPAIARGVMGSYYKTATAAQQQRFGTAFEKSIVKIYSDSLMKINPASITIVPAVASAKPNKAKVAVKIVAEDGGAYQVSYSMLLKDNKWFVRNIVVDGVNFGLTYRNQFKSEMQRNGNNIDQVIANWAKSAK